jgi:hypothetical protein
MVADFVSSPLRADVFLSMRRISFNAHVAPFLLPQ